MTILGVIFPQPGVAAWFAATQVVLVLVTTIIQYAWTFFYLRLVEVESPGVEAGPFHAATGQAPRSGSPDEPTGEEPAEAERSSG
jgi:hypothetical protein